MITPTLLSWTWLSLLLLIGGLLLGNVILVTGAVFLFVAILTAATLRPPDDITIERSMPRAICWVGDSLEVQRHVTIRHGIGPVRVLDVLPSDAQVIDGSNFRIIWKWRGEQSVDLSYRIAFPKRGEYSIPETVWESQAPLGAGRGKAGSAGPPLELLVAPRNSDITKLNSVRAMARKSRLGEDIALIRASGEEFRELRPYQPGDPIKSINWKATSRNSGDSNPLVNELEPEGRKAVWIFFDIADYMNIGTPVSSPMENSIEAAGTLAQYYISQGATLGAYAYNTQAGGELLSPDTGQKQFRRLTRLFAGLQPGPPNLDLLLSFEWCKSFLFRLQPHVFIITRLDAHYPRPGESAESMNRMTTAIRRLTALRARSRRRSRVRVVHVNPDPQAVPSLSGAFDKVSAWESMAVMSEVRRAGAAVMDWNPSRERFIANLVRHMDTYQ